MIHRSLAMTLSATQFIVLIISMGYYTEKKPLFYYSTSVSYADAMQSYNTSNHFMKLYFYNGYLQERTGVVSVDVYYNYFQHKSDKITAAVNSTYQNNNNHSRIQLFIMPVFVLFALPSFIACLYSFHTMRTVDCGQMTIGTTYGDHGVKENLGWEVVFWVFVWTQHVVVQLVLGTPINIFLVAGLASHISVLLMLFCTVAVNGESDSASRRFEGPFFILICLTYFIVVQNSKILLGLQFTYLIWFTHILCDVALVFGHLADNPVQMETVLNCRWAYVILTCWVNVVLYIAF